MLKNAGRFRHGVSVSERRRHLKMASIESCSLGVNKECSAVLI
jgi:hypothetical protein